jgi:hypothetical protein
MTRYNFTTFYGSYGHMIVHNNGKTSLEIIWNGYIPQKPYRKTYKTFRGAKIALGRIADAYTLTECK